MTAQTVAITVTDEHHRILQQVISSSLRGSSGFNRVGYVGPLLRIALKMTAEVFPANGLPVAISLFHLRVIDQSGLPLRIEQAWVRNLMRVFDALPFAYLVGGISVLSSAIMQRFGDRVTGTNGAPRGLEPRPSA